MKRRFFIAATAAVLFSSKAKAAPTAPTCKPDLGDSSIITDQGGFLVFKNPKIYDGSMAFKYDPNTTHDADKENGVGQLGELEFNSQPLFPDGTFVPGGQYTYDQNNKLTMVCRCGNRKPQPTAQQVQQAREEAERLLASRNNCLSYNGIKPLALTA